MEIKKNPKAFSLLTATIQRRPLINVINSLAIISLPFLGTMNITYASDDVVIGIDGSSGGSGSSASSAGSATNGSDGSSGSDARTTSSGGNGSNGADGSNGANGSAGTEGSSGASGDDKTSTLRNVKDQLGLLQIGGSGGEGGTAGEASAGTDGGTGGAGGNGGNGGTTGTGGDGGDGGNGGNGGNGADGGSGGDGAAGGNGTLTINQSNFTITNGVIGASGGNASDGQDGQSGGNGGAGNSGGIAGTNGTRASGGLPGNGGNGGKGGTGGNGGDGALGGAGGSGSMTLDNTKMSVKSALTVGGSAGSGSSGGEGAAGGQGGDAWTTSDSASSTGDNGSGGNSGTGGKGGQGANGGDGGTGILTLTNSIVSAQSVAIGGNGGNGGDGGNSGANGISGTTSTSGSVGVGSAGGQGGTAGDGGSAGAGSIVLENSTLTVTSDIQIGGNGGNGGNGGDLQGSNAAGAGGNASDGASGTLTFTSSVINNKGTLTLGGQGGDAGDGGINNSAKGRSGNGGEAGNGGTGTAIFISGSGQIASDIQIGGQNGNHEGALNNSSLAQTVGEGGAGILDIRGGTFTAGTLTLGVANIWSSLTDTLTTIENQFLQSGGTFQVDSSVLNNGSMAISDGIFASETLEANQGTLTISGDGTAIFGSTELNENSWQEKVALLQEDLAVTFNGKLVLSGDTTLDLSSTDLNWRVGGNEYTSGLGASSLTVLNARSWIDSGNAALAMGSAQIDSGAYLLILTDDSITAGESFTAVTSSGVSESATWQEANISTTSRLLTATQTASTDSTLITINSANLSSALPAVSKGTTTLLSAMSDQIGVNVTSDNAAQQFISKAMDVRYVSDADTSARLVESAINLASIANVAGTSFRVMSATAKTLSHHLSMGQHFFQGTPVEEGFNLWTSLLYDNSRLSGYNAGGFNAKTKTWLGGIFIGGEDTLLTNLGGILKTGGALNVGKGKSRSMGNLYPVKNDVDFWGASLYGSWINGSWNLLGDINYAKVSHSMKQSLDPITGYSNLSGDAKSTIISAGLTREYVFETDTVDIMPHVGIRYTQLKNNAFNAKSEGKVLFKNGSNSQSLWSVPLGVRFSKEYKNDSGYTLKPALDLSWTATGSDTISGTQVTMAGVTGHAQGESRIADSSAYGANAGFLLQKDNLTYGLNYGIQKSSNETSQTVAASFNLKF
ncbi:autotransporter family protein [Erwinia psidii]|uniref:autotransporter family protein n=1 Tax=Erwinia psidii TaxID=69224 RepID=UPI001315141B|nr:autotransporter outer membrane beta-barrel domain-containing protein [Erwinia psidii]